ncbi:hypothetical protein SUGI_1120890 [Cryptomeria japonica]|nr:hypothetical protein SUGI_1120890 [Cryptomeria japonica]
MNGIRTDVVDNKKHLKRKNFHTLIRNREIKRHMVSRCQGRQRGIDQGCEWMQATVKCDIKITDRTNFKVDLQLGKNWPKGEYRVVWLTEEWPTKRHRPFKYRGDCIRVADLEVREASIYKNKPV